MKHALTVLNPPKLSDTLQINAWKNQTPSIENWEPDKNNSWSSWVEDRDSYYPANQILSHVVQIFLLVIDFSFLPLLQV